MLYSIDKENPHSKVDAPEKITSYILNENNSLSRWQTGEAFLFALTISLVEKV